MGAVFTGLTEQVLAYVLVIFATSLPFTIVGATILTSASFLLRELLSRDWATYIPIFVIAAIAGPLMVALTIGVELQSAFLGEVFALATAAVWVVIYRSRLPSEMGLTEDA